MLIQAVGLIRRVLIGTEEICSFPARAVTYE